MIIKDDLSTLNDFTDLNTTPNQDKTDNYFVLMQSEIGMQSTPSHLSDIRH